jgi:hypothetical protein
MEMDEDSKLKAIFGRRDALFQREMRGDNDDEDDSLPTPMSVLKKRKGEKAEEKRLYTPQFTCCVCLEELGVKPGLVMCVSVSCKPQGHCVCYACTTLLKPNSKGALECPACRTCPVKFVPIHGLVDEVADPEAKAVMAAAVAMARPEKPPIKKLRAKTHRLYTDARSVVTPVVDSARPTGVLNLQRMRLEVARGIIRAGYPYPEAPETKFVYATTPNLGAGFVDYSIDRSTFFGPRSVSLDGNSMDLAAVLHELSQAVARQLGTEFPELNITGSDHCAIVSDTGQEAGYGDKFVYMALRISRKPTVVVPE